MTRLLIPLLLLVMGCSPDPGQHAAARVGDLLGGDSSAGFQRAMAPRTFRFPRDHAVHPGFRSEWWYITGNLDSAAGRRFGFQVTFFRFALTPAVSAARSSGSHWATRHMWMAHIAITDPRERRHYATERLAREALGLAGTSTSPFRVWLGAWSLSGTGPGFPWKLAAAGEGFGLQLSLEPNREPVLQGRDGLSQKGNEPGNASYYYSVTRLQTKGTLQLGDRRFEVSGLSWLDREWGTSALGPEQIGWDWFSLQLHDGTDIMYYRLRTRSGNPDPHSAGTVLLKSGEKLLLGPGDVRLQPKKWWISPGGKRYPVTWRVTIEPLDRTFLVSGVIDAQEMDLSLTYWEGATDVSSAGKLVGRGYLEMTGY